MTNIEQLCNAVKSEENDLLLASHRQAEVRRRLAVARLPAAPRSRWRMRAAIALALACVVVGLASVFWQAREERRLTAVIGESLSAVSAGAWLQAPHSISLPVRFSDGSRVDVAPLSRMRLLELEPAGAKIELESGRVGMNIAHLKNRAWELRAGPFVVAVTGTRFDIEWSPRDDHFALALDEGQVEIAGCGFGTGRKLVAGQTVYASCHDGNVKVVYSRDATSFPMSPSQKEAESQKPLTESAPPVETMVSNVGTAILPKAPAVNTAPDWVTLAEQGKYGDAMAAVERRGFAAECNRAPLAELALLGETARHVHAFDKAHLALLTLRRRFSGTAKAGVAAFSLGVIEFDQQRAYAKASEWFRVYVKENPSGPLIREARGRLMEASYRSSSGDARVLATAYLRDYPAGPHAELAQRILQTP